MSAHEIKQTESLVNEKIGLFLDVTTEEMSLADMWILLTDWIFFPIYFLYFSF